ncbi:MAG: immune inhibitor A [candidate division Zixibacteria bacterium]|nr:immune inhibitor A [candidate division Zixibacteria bacterium]
MARSRAVSAVLLMLAVVTLDAASAQQTNVQARVHVTSVAQYVRLMELHPEIAREEPGIVEVIIPEKQLTALVDLGYRVDIVHDDIVSFYQSRLPAKSMGGYKTLAEIASHLDSAIADHADLISGPHVIGQSLEERTILAYKISDYPELDEDEPEVLYTAAIHAREVITPEVLLYYMDHLTDQYGIDSNISAMVDNRELWFIPVVNPDGYVYNENTSPEGGGMWRKNRRDNGDGTFGVDINRNYGYMWGYDDIGSSPDGEDEDYRGSGPFSEPESQVMRDFISSHSFVVTVYYHSYGNLVIWPYAYKKEVYTPENRLFAAVGEYLETLNGYYPNPAWTLYPINGFSDDWGFAEQTLKNKNYAFTIEVGGYDDGFWPELSRISDLVSENLAGNVYLASIAGNMQSALRPLPPAVTHPDTISFGEAGTISWSSDDTLNPAVCFELTEFQGQHRITDSVKDVSHWINKDAHFTLSINAHSGDFSFFSGAHSTVNRYIQSQYPYVVQPHDTLKFWTKYGMPLYWDYAYVEISTDGESFSPIPGNITTNENLYGHNRGNGITGDQYLWKEALFDLSAFVGDSIYMRFSFRDYSVALAYWGIHIDDISPVVCFDTAIVLASDLTDTAVTISDKPPGEYYYRVRAKDADEQWSLPSSLAKVTIAEAPEPRCGDVNGDNNVDLLDILFLISHIYGNPPGPTPEDPESADVNADGDINLLDILHLISYLYGNPPGPDPTCP